MTTTETTAETPRTGPTTVPTLEELATDVADRLQRLILTTEWDMWEHNAPTQALLENLLDDLDSLRDTIPFAHTPRTTRARLRAHPHAPRPGRTTEMANETALTIVGNLTADPEMRYTQTGVALTKFTVASTPRQYDKNAGEWRDGEPLFLTCTAWRQLAEHITESLTKGARVVITGRLKLSRWETDEGEKRSAYGLDVEEVGPSLRYATAQVKKMTRTTGTGGTGTGTSADDPWATATAAAPAGTAAAFGTGTGSDAEPPF